MHQPEFTWWPWRFLALTVPLLALGGAVVAAYDHRPHQEVLTIFFSVLAAANGYLFAMAVGDFGRSIAAIPIGALSGFAAVHLFSFPLSNVVFVILLFAVAGFSVGGRTMRALSGCLMMVFLFIAFISFMTMLFNRYRDQRAAELCVFCAYPFVCGCVAASMPIENSWSAIAQAGLAGIRAALHGMGVGGSLALGCAFVLGLFLSGRGSQMEILAVLILAGSVALINYFCVQNIFTAVHRAGSVPADSAVTAGPSDLPAEPPEQAPENKSSDA